MKRAETGNINVCSRGAMVGGTIRPVGECAFERRAQPQFATDGNQFLLNELSTKLPADDKTPRYILMEEVSQVATSAYP